MILAMEKPQSLMNITINITLIKNRLFDRNKNDKKTLWLQTQSLDKQLTKT